MGLLPIPAPRLAQVHPLKGHQWGTGKKRCPARARRANAPPLTSVLNLSLSLSETLRNRVSLTSVLYSSSPFELHRKSLPPEDDGALELLSDLPPESTSDPISRSDDSAMGSRPWASHSVTRHRLDKGSRLYGCNSCPAPPTRRLLRCRPLRGGTAPTGPAACPLPPLAASQCVPTNLCAPPPL